jgi:hypothetical protein
MAAFRCYNPADAGGDAREAWRMPIPSAFDADVDAAMEIREQERTLEDKRYFKSLRGRCEGLTEVLIDITLESDDPRRTQKQQKVKIKRSPREKVAIRVLGFGSAENFVLLYGFRKYGGPDYGPACHSALNRRLGVDRDDRRARPCSFK